MEHFKNLIIGAGLSGLLMARLLKRGETMVIEAQAESKVSSKGHFFYLHEKIDGLPLRWHEVDVHQNCWDGEFHRVPTIGMMNDYSRKITGKIVNNSLKFMDGRHRKGYIPEGDIEESLKDGLQIKYEQALSGINPLEKTATIGSVKISYDHLISTIPLPSLLRVLGVDLRFEFQAQPIYTAEWTLSEGEAVDAYQIVYITSQASPVYRISLLGDRIVAESMVEKFNSKQLIERIWDTEEVSLVKYSAIFPGKFHPIPKPKRQILLNDLTREYGIYCLGRYAVWDYKRLDHVAEDAKRIVALINMRTS